MLDKINENGFNNVPSIKELLQSGDFNKAFGLLSNKIDIGLEYSKEFLKDLFRIAETTQNLDTANTQNCCYLFDKAFKDII